MYPEKKKKSGKKYKPIFQRELNILKQTYEEMKYYLE